MPTMPNPPVDFVNLARWYEEGKLPLDKLVSKRYPLDDINEAFADMLAGTIRRGMVVFD